MELNARSRKALKGVHPTLVKLIETAALLAPDGIDFQIVQGLRTGAQQDALYAQGRTKPGPKVTWTRNSNHEDQDGDGYGAAIDFQAIHKGTPTWTEKYYKPIAEHIKKVATGLKIPVQWGYDLWKKDLGHIQLPKGVKVPSPKDFESTRLIQERLAAHGYAIKADGQWGPKTGKAFDDFQKSKKLRPTMQKLDDATWKALKDKPNTLKAVEFYRSKGLTKPQAVAMVGGFQQESWKHLDPTSVGDQGTAFGVGQWRNERKVALDLLAKQRGVTWADFDTQLQHSWNELQTTEKRTLKLLKAAITIEDSAKAAIGFFRPAGFTWANPEKGHGFANRLANAIKVYENTPN
jgi:peptidoglycan hydrolase-like protein with peptidoglycan-binding domain